MLKNELLQFARRRQAWINGGEYERIAMDLGFKPSNASRRLRELQNEGRLEKRLNEKRCVEYKYIPLPEEQIRQPENTRQLF